MGESQLTTNEPELYERLIDRLGLALDMARTSSRLRDEMPMELELRGLSRAEFELIKAYLASLQARRQASVGVHRQTELPSARIVWLKDRKRSTAAPIPRTLPGR